MRGQGVIKMMQKTDQSPGKLLETQKLSVDGNLSITGGLVDDFSSAVNAKRAIENLPMDGNSPFS